MATKKPKATQKKNKRSNKLEMEQKKRNIGIIGGKKLPNMITKMISGLSSRKMYMMSLSFLIIIPEVRNLYFVGLVEMPPKHLMMANIPQMLSYISWENGK